jgi:Ribosomal protein L7/L12 C-terminal domain
VEDPGFTVLVTGAPPGGTGPLRAVRTVTGLSLWRARRLLDAAPATLAERIPFDLADDAAHLLREAGVRVVLRCDWCRRALPEDGTPVGPGPCASRYWPVAHCRANSLTSCDCDFCEAYGPLPGHDGRPRERNPSPFIPWGVPDVWSE